MAKRKTVNVEALKLMTNTVLRTSTCAADVRRGWLFALEWALHDTGNYRGFRYLTVNEVPSNGAPGIRMGVDGEMLSEDLRWQSCDDTRREYN
jgi:hypothetical protein